MRLVFKNFILRSLIYIIIQVLTELQDTNQSINLVDEHGNTLVHAAAKFHMPDCLSVRLHGCTYMRQISMWKTLMQLHVKSFQKSF